MRKVEINTKNKIILENIEGFVKRRVSKFGNSAKVSCPKEFLDKEVYLVFIKNEIQQSN
jgi:putative transposon-encoded protein